MMSSMSIEVWCGLLHVTNLVRNPQAGIHHLLGIFALANRICVFFWRVRDGWRKRRKTLTTKRLVTRHSSQIDQTNEYPLSYGYKYLYCTSQYMFIVQFRRIVVNSSTGIRSTAFVPVLSTSTPVPPLERRHRDDRDAGKKARQYHVLHCGTYTTYSAYWNWCNEYFTKYSHIHPTFDSNCWPTLDAFRLTISRYLQSCFTAKSWSISVPNTL